MIRAMYSGVSGMRGFQVKLDVIGNNIANVNTIGFKSGRVMFKDILSQSMAGATAPVEGETGGVNPRQVGLGVTVSSIDTLHMPGSAMTTNNPLDLRIDGDGFFVLSPTGDADGPLYLTRAGNFLIDGNRQLVNPDGLFVLSTDGAPIIIDEGITSVSIAQDGSVLGVDDTGAVVNIAQIGLARVVNPGGLEKVGSNLYRLTVNANPDGELGDLLPPNSPEDGTGAIIAGQLEMSNVDLTVEFTEMIIAQRGFQANSRIITTSDEILQEVVNLKR
ncbi:MAG TPA: flagellar basal body rod protein FlgG [Paenibacillaceae bacterium]